MQRMGLRKKMIVNTASNYVYLALRTVISIFLTRTIFLGISRQNYGYWAVLWSVFGYSLLLDFGFGISIQKYTSEVSVNKDWDKYNRLISTVFFNYCGLSVIIIVAALVLSRYLGAIFNLEPGSDLSSYKSLFVIFGIGTAFVFPFGFFAEMLRGLQLIKLRNMVSGVFLVVNFIAMTTAIKAGYGLMGMTVVTILVNLFTNLSMGYLCFKKIPQLSIRLRYYSISLLREVMSFSLFAYLIMFSNLIIFRTDQMVISIFGAVKLVAVYQIASRLAELFRQFSTQFHDNLGPVASTLFTAGKKGKLAEILIQSNRLIGFIATLMLVPLLVYIKPLLQIWLELSDRDGTNCAVILLVSMYFLVFFRSSSVQILLMVNKQRGLTKIAMAECVMNLVLSVILVKRIGIVGVALGTLVPNVLLGLTCSLPMACKFSGISIVEFLRLSVVKTVMAGCVAAGVALGLRTLHYPDTFVLLALHALVVIMFYLAAYYLLAVEKWEKKQLRSFIKAKLGKTDETNASQQEDIGIETL